METKKSMKKNLNQIDDEDLIKIDEIFKQKQQNYFFDKLNLICYFVFVLKFLFKNIRNK